MPFSKKPGGVRTAVVCAVAVTALGARAGASVYINEIFFDPEPFNSAKDPKVHAGGTNEFRSYVELRGTPGESLAGMYLVNVDGDNLSSGSMGSVSDYFNLSNFSFGSNGFMTLQMRSSPYSANPLANNYVQQNDGSGAATNTGFGHAARSSVGFHTENTGVLMSIEFGSKTFMLVRAADPANAPAVGDDYDANNDGVLDGAKVAGWQVFDSIGLLDGADFDGDIVDHSYGAITFRTSSDLNDTAVSGNLYDTTLQVDSTDSASGTLVAEYFGRKGNSTGSTLADWVAATVRINERTTDVVGSALPYTIDAATDEAWVGTALNHLGSTNVPEPASLAVAGMAALGLLARRRRAV